MMFNRDVIMEALDLKRPLAVADRILLDPKPGELVARTDALAMAILSLRESRPVTVAQAIAQLGLNLIGAETVWAGYSDEERSEAYHVWQGQKSLQYMDSQLAASVVWDLRQEMKSINKGDSLPGLWEGRIVLEQGINPIMSFVDSMREMIEKCVYWQMFRKKMCKFGNDFARGLRWGRLVGFCQVSTNPVLAYKAYLEDQALGDVLRDRIAKRKEWMQNPEDFAREIAMEATLLALFPNLEIFRPLAILTRLRDFQVSLQLNPEIADDAQASIEDATMAFARAREFLTQYDHLLGLEKPGEVNPNIVFKVAANHPAAVKITRELNRLGIPTNNTLVYSVGQEIKLFLAALCGKAEAIANGLPIARGYMTNMGGRLTSHLREQEAIKVFVTLARKSIGRAFDLLNALAQDLKVDPMVWGAVVNGDIETKARVLCAFGYLKSLDQEVIIKAAGLIGRSAVDIRILEQDLRMAGTLVVQRVWQTFFRPENRKKWLYYLKTNFNITEAQAQTVLNSIDCLPASKRIPEDTFKALGEQGMTHTEFPNHARAVQLFAEREGFVLGDFTDSVCTDPDPSLLGRLNRIPEFRRAYGLNPSLYSFLDLFGFDLRGWNQQGLSPGTWSSFGPCQKTSSEFQQAFLDFVKMCLALTDK